MSAMCSYADHVMMPSRAPSGHGSVAGSLWANERRGGISSQRLESRARRRRASVSTGLTSHPTREPGYVRTARAQVDDSIPCPDVPEPEAPKLDPPGATELDDFLGRARVVVEPLVARRFGAGWARGRGRTRVPEDPPMRPRARVSAVPNRGRARADMTASGFRWRVTRPPVVPGRRPRARPGSSLRR